MRDVLFRGREMPGRYDREGTELRWFKGYYSADTYGDRKRHFITPLHDEFVRWEVTPETVSEYSGLTDKNGNQIFEGDIVKRSGTNGEYAGNYLVTFEDGCFMLVSVKCFYDKWQPRRPFSIFHDWQRIEPEDMMYEVIGNRWDNPELLEADEK